MSFRIFLPDKTFLSKIVKQGVNKYADIFILKHKKDNFHTVENVPLTKSFFFSMPVWYLNTGPFLSGSHSDTYMGLPWIKNNDDCVKQRKIQRVKVAHTGLHWERSLGEGWVAL